MSLMRLMVTEMERLDSSGTWNRVLILVLLLKKVCEFLLEVI